jgi:hypothetical protein
MDSRFCESCGYNYQLCECRTVVKTLRPTAYTTVEGGKWYPWSLEGITESQLASALALYNVVNVRLKAGTIRVSVHTLKFLDGREWDCINGWR